MTDSFTYDVAFSFVADDESVARKLNDLISDRLNTFIYSDRQQVLAGTDGEETFARVFGKETRVVVILHRAAWGETRWTRIEQTAIRNRGYEEGYDFTVFIPMDTAPLPRWLPKTRIWANLDRWGFEGAASVIEARVQDMGGVPRVESFESRAARLDRERAFTQEREQFLRSLEGVDTAVATVKDLFRLLKDRADLASKSATTFKIDCEVDGYSCVIRSPTYSILLSWFHTYSNSLTESALAILEFRRAYFLNRSNAELERIRDQKFHFDIEAGALYGWRESPGSKLLTNSSLADELFNRLFQQLQTS